MNFEILETPDSFADLKDLGKGEFDVVITDPPYDEHTQNNQVSGTAMKKWVNGEIKSSGIPKKELPFTHLTGYEFTADLLHAARRWAIMFCAVEGFGDIRRVVGKSYKRGAFWYKPNCLSGRTLLYARTQRGVGPQRLEKLVKLDPTTVQLWDGSKWSQVLRWAPTVHNESVRLVLRNGQRINTTLEHRWPTTRGLLPTCDLRVGDVIDSCQLPESLGETHMLADLDVAWFLGLYFAEGSQSGKTIQIAGHKDETERHERLTTFAARWGGKCSVYATSTNGVTANLTACPVIFAMISTFIGGRVACDKHVKPRFWRQSNAWLEAFFAGYLSGDGHWEAVSRRWRVNFCLNRLWAENLRAIAARLGWDARISRTMHTANGCKYPGFRATFQREAKSSGSEITQIMCGNGSTFFDVEVADDPHTFALASGVLTHNSQGQMTGDRPAIAGEGIVCLHEGKSQWNGRGSYGFWPCNSTRGKKDRHPNEKPLDLCLKLVALFSDRGETIFDPFCGSAAIGEAALLLGRRYVGWDSDPLWVARAEERLKHVAFGSMSDEAALKLCTAKKSEIVEVGVGE